MYKQILAVLTAMAVLPVGASNEQEVSDSSRVYDLDEIVVVAQNKEYQKLRQQPMSSNVLT